MEIKPCLENLKSNVIRWYKFKENSKILIIGKDVENMCDFLKENHTVFAVSENNYKTEKFDYIIIKEDIYCLSEYKDCLVEDGTILLLMNNRWGVEHFTKANGFKIKATEKPLSHTVQNDLSKNSNEAER